MSPIRSGPLLPVWLFAALGLLALLLLALAAHHAVRRCWPWLLSELTVLLALGSAHVLLFWQPYRSGAVIPRGGGDLASFFYPLHAFAAREVQAGRMPFWNPTQFLGAPHLANFQAGTLYPPNLITWLLADPFTYAWLEALTLAHFVWAAWGTYWLARAFGHQRPAATLAGALFASSGFMVAHLGHYSMLATAAWLPWVLAAVVATVRYRSAFAAWAGVPALACMVLAGHQPILLMGLTLTAAVAVFELWRADRDARVSAPDATQPPTRVDAWITRRVSRWLWGADAAGERRVSRWLPSLGVVLPRALPLVAMAGLALLLTLPMLGPSLLLLRETVRSGLSYEQASAFAVQPIALLHVVLPTIFGSNATDFWGSYSSTEIWGYTGVLALLLAAYGVVAGREGGRTRRLWLLAAVVALLFMLGPFASLHGWVYAFLPGWDRARAAGRAYLVLDLAVALLAASGLAALLRGYAGARPTHAVSEARTHSDAAGLASAPVDHWSLRERVALQWGLRGIGAALAVLLLVVVPLQASRILVTEEAGNRPVILLDNLLMLTLWLGLGLAVGVAIWRGVLRGALLVLAVAAVLLLDVFHATSPFNPTTADVLAGFRHEQVIDHIRTAQAADGPSRVDVVTERWQPDTAMVAELEDIGGLVDPLALQSVADYLGPARADRSSDAYRALNVRFLIGDVEQEMPEGYREVARDGSGVVLWEAAAWQPRAWIVGSITPLTVRTPAPGRVEIDLPAGHAGGTLVISQADYPGWSARVEGSQRTTVTPDTYAGALQSVEVTSDVQRVVLTFTPQGWGFWLAMGALGGLLWLGWLGFLLVGRRNASWRRRSGAVRSPA